MIAEKAINPLSMRRKPISRRNFKLVPSIRNFGTITRNLERNVDKLFRDLAHQGIVLEEQPKIYRSENGDDYVEIPDASNSAKKDIVGYKEIHLIGREYLVAARVLVQNYPTEVLIGADKYAHPPYSLILFANDVADLERRLVVGSFPVLVGAVGVNFDFRENPETREVLSRLGRKRISASFYKTGTSVFGYEDKSGLVAFVTLNLQQENREQPLKCYEVEILGNTFHPDTTKISPESVWQPDQNHYCMASQETFPLIPLDVNSLSGISFVANLMEDPQRLTEILNGLPLTIDGKNQWYVKFPSDVRSVISFLYNPQWQNHNSVVLYEERGTKNFSPHHIYNAASNLHKLRKTIN